MSRFLAAALAASTMLVPGIVAAQQAMVPLSAYGELPGVSDVAISPTGQHLAGVITIQGQRKIVMMDSTMKVLRAIGVGDVKVRDLEWIGDDAIMMYSTQTERLNSDYAKEGDNSEFLVATIISLDKEKPNQVVFSNSRNVMSTIRGTFGVRNTPKGWRGYFGGIELEKATDFSRQVVKNYSAALFAVDLADNRPVVAAKPAAAGFWRDWLLDSSGEVGATFNMSGSTGAWTIVGKDSIVLAEGKSASGRADMLGFGPSGQTVVYSLFDEDRGETVWYEVPLAGGAAKEFLGDVGVKDLVYEPYSRKIIGYVELGDKERYVFFDKDTDARARKVQAAFAKLNLSIASFTPDMTKVVARTSGNNDSGTWFLVDTVNLKASAIGYERLAVGAKVGPISSFAYTASDGTALDGVLTLPYGKEAKNLPVVILPHGGPHSYDQVEFDYWAQGLASRGYAVLQPNFRGSSHRGDAFRRAGYGEWGGKMQTDISDGLAALAAKGIVDPKRACIVGASFGGYAALAGVTVQQGLYRCAVAVAPVSDIETMFNEGKYRGAQVFGARVGQTAFAEQLGDKANWAAHSPLRLAAKADAPVLLIHGKDDTVVPFSHSTRMQEALQKAGKPVTLVTLTDEDHWLSRAPTRMQMLEATVAFLEKHNPAN